MAARLAGGAMGPATCPRAEPAAAIQTAARSAKTGQEVERRVMFPIIFRMRAFETEWCAPALSKRLWPGGDSVPQSELVRRSCRFREGKSKFNSRGEILRNDAGAPCGPLNRQRGAPRSSNFQARNTLGNPGWLSSRREIFALWSHDLLPTKSSGDFT